MAARKYQGRHPKLRIILLRHLVPGTPCPQVVNGKICGQPMYPTQALDLGHDPRGGWLGLVHARCNRQEGAINSNRGIVRRPLVTIATTAGRGRRW